MLWAVVWGCSAEPSPPVAGAIEVEGPVAFTVNGVEVPQTALDVLIQRVGRKQARWLDDNDRTTEFVEHVALTQALYQKALQAGLDADPEVQLLLAMGQREILAKEYLRWAAARAITPEVVAERYAQMPQFRIPQLKIRHLRLRDAGEAAALRQRLEEGTPFPDLAREASQDAQTAAVGGDLGWLDVSVVEATFGAEVASAQPGAVLGPLSTAGGVHLVWIEDRRSAIPLAEVEAGLTEELRTEEGERIAGSIRQEMRIERPQ